MNDSLSQVRFYQELAEMKTQHEVDKLELKNRQMDLEVAQAHSHLLKWERYFPVNSVLPVGLYIVQPPSVWSTIEVGKERGGRGRPDEVCFPGEYESRNTYSLNAIVGFRRYW